MSSIRLGRYMSNRCGYAIGGFEVWHSGEKYVVPEHVLRMDIWHRVGQQVPMVGYSSGGIFGGVSARSQGVKLEFLVSLVLLGIEV